MAPNKKGTAMDMDMDELLYLLEQSGNGNLDPSVIAMLSGTSVVSSIMSLAIAVLTIVAMWKIFTKAGEAGWKAIIPSYNQYILFKIVWKRKWFWITLILSLIVMVMMWDVMVYTLGGAQGITEDTFLTVVLGLTIAMVVFSIPLLIINIILYWNLSKAFGKGAGFFFGLLFLNIIFLCILAFGSAVYCGPKGEGVPADVAARINAQAVPVVYPAAGYAPAGAVAQPVQGYAPVQQGYVPLAQQQSPYAAPSVYAPASGTYVPQATAPATPQQSAPAVGTYEAPKTPFDPQQ